MIDKELNITLTPYSTEKNSKILANQSQLHKKHTLGLVPISDNSMA